MQYWPSCKIVLYVCKRGRRENPKYVIMTFRQKARVRENPKKRDRTIDMYRREGPKYVPGPCMYSQREGLKYVLGPYVGMYVTM